MKLTLLYENARFNLKNMPSKLRTSDSYLIDHINIHIKKVSHPQNCLWAQMCGYINKRKAKISENACKTTNTHRQTCMHERVNPWMHTYANICIHTSTVGLSWIFRHRPLFFYFPKYRWKAVTFRTNYNTGLNSLRPSRCIITGMHWLPNYWSDQRNE